MNKIVKQIKPKLKPCPLCGGKVRIAIGGDDEKLFYFITRGIGADRCECRLFLESEQFYEDDSDDDENKVKQMLIAHWNQRV